MSCGVFPAVSDVRGGLYNPTPLSNVIQFYSAIDFFTMCLIEQKQK